MQRYYSEVPPLPDAALAVFLGYCGLQKDMVNGHIHDVVSSIPRGRREYSG